MNRRIVRLCILLLVVAASTIVSTWPLVERAWTHVPVHQDPLFSTWRLYQWSRNLLGDGPGGWADGNIFHPAPDVLFFSDAIPLLAFAAAPFIWIGVPPLQMYDLLFWASFLTAGLGMYLFARDLSGSHAGGLVAATIFAGSPYRAEHIMHLELLWTCWIPLAFWATRRLLAGETRVGRWLTVALVAQFLCCVYYGLFLLTILPIVAGIAWAVRPHPITRPILLRFGIALAVTVVVIGVYSVPYQRVRATLGDRDLDEIRNYSAQLSNYLATPYGNKLWGWTAHTLGDSEERSSAGLTAYLVALPALLPPLQPWTIGLAAGTLFAVDASRGLDGYVYPVLHRYVSPYGGLRVPARFAAIVLACVSALAAIGMARIERAISSEAPPQTAQKDSRLRFAGGSIFLPRSAGRRPRMAVAVTAIVIIALLCEYRTTHPTRQLPKSAPALYAWLGQQPSTVIAHLPMPASNGLPGPEADFEYFAQYHRHKLVNGNSGYYPPSYLLLLDRVSLFPDERAMRALRGEGVTLVMLHAQHYSRGVYEEKVLATQDVPGTEDLGEFFDERGRVRVFRILPE